MDLRGPTSKGKERGREGGVGEKEWVRKKERGGRGKGNGGESVPLTLILQFDHCTVCLRNIRRAFKFRKPLLQYSYLPFRL